jgi:hypothetical protein
MNLELFFNRYMKVTFSNTSSFKLYLGHRATYYLLPKDVAFTNPIEF